MKRIGEHHEGLLCGPPIETHDATKLNDAGGIGINPDSAIPRWLSVGTDRAKTKPRPRGTKGRG
jgi:hypothetical protein